MPASKKLNSRRAIVYAVILALFALADFHPAFFVAGGVLILLGQAIRIWATGHLEKNRKLTCTGPYAHVKNPLYLGTLLIVGGFCLAGGSPSGRGLWVILGLLPVCLLAYYGYYFPFKREVEGDRLIRRFGKSAEHYLEEVPNLLPSLKAYPGGSESWKWARFLKNSEHLTVLAVLIGVCLLVIRTNADRIPGLENLLR